MYYLFQHWLDPNKNILRQIKSKYFVQLLAVMYFENFSEIIDRMVGKKDTLICA